MAQLSIAASLAAAATAAAAAATRPALCAGACGLLAKARHMGSGSGAAAGKFSLTPAALVPSTTAARELTTLKKGVPGEAPAWWSAALPRELWRAAAVHEAGRVLAMVLLMPEAVPLTRARAEFDNSPEVLRAAVMVSLAGEAAELLINRKTMVRRRRVSKRAMAAAAAAADDMRNAVGYALAALCKSAAAEGGGELARFIGQAMGDAVRAANRRDKSGAAAATAASAAAAPAPALAPAPAVKPSESLKRQLEAEARLLLEAAFHEVAALLAAHEPELRALAQALLERGALTGAEAREVVAAAAAAKQAAAAAGSQPGEQAGAPAAAAAAAAAAVAAAAAATAAAAAGVADNITSRPGIEAPNAKAAAEPSADPRWRSAVREAGRVLLLLSREDLVLVHSVSIAPAADGSAGRLEWASGGLKRGPLNAWAGIRRLRDWNFHYTHGKREGGWNEEKLCCMDAAACLMGEMAEQLIVGDAAGFDNARQQAVSAWVATKFQKVHEPMWISTCVYEPELRALAQALLEHGVLTGTQAKEVVAAATAEKLVWATAVHEAGHALAALLLLPGIVDVESASIVPDEKTLGRVSMMASNMLCGCVHSRAVHCAMPWPWKALSLATQILLHTQRKPGELSVRQLRHLVMVFMAGEAGEAVFPGVISTEDHEKLNSDRVAAMKNALGALFASASAELARGDGELVRFTGQLVTAAAAAAARGSPAGAGREPAAGAGGDAIAGAAPRAASRLASPALERLLTAEAQGILSGALAEVPGLLRAHQPQLAALAHALAAHKVLTGAQVKAAVAGPAPGAPLAAMAAALGLNA
ncbi:MAG: hypothetical protein J3K34DRAFT_392958 [Monoraphidium minutum]|nr:MAG: hypothetical protein J3K34DRAFT_392958 [Monoraphidium minutum]